MIEKVEVSYPPEISNQLTGTACPVRGFPIHRYDIVLSRIQRIFEKETFNTANPLTILDVGGFVENPGIPQSWYENGHRIWSVNVNGEYHGKNGHVIYNGEHLPFPNDCFPIVICVDVLEHIPKPQRQSFMEELLRVAKDYLIISVPFGSERNKQLEKDFLDALQRANLPPKHSFVEHERYGLPTLKELMKMAQSTGFEWTIEPATNAEINFAGLHKQIYAMEEDPNNNEKVKQIRSETERQLRDNPPSSWKEAYRAVVIIKKN